jgi:hypothetical protein
MVVLFPKRNAHVSWQIDSRSKKKRPRPPQGGADVFVCSCLFRFLTRRCGWKIEKGLLIEADFIAVIDKLHVY